MEELAPLQMSYYIKLGVLIFSILIIFPLILKKPPFVMVHKRKLIVILAFVCSAGYFNFGLFHGHGRFVQMNEFFNYFIGSKYYPELGYDGILVASLLAKEQNDPKFKKPLYIRDLRTMNIVLVDDISFHKDQVRERFSEKRWSEFVKDVNQSRQPARTVWIDHGYNPTPAWTFVGRLFTAHLPFTKSVKRLLSLIDVILMFVAFFILYRTFGLLTLTCALVIFCLNFTADFYWTGGAFIRHDWLATLMIGICLLKQKHYTMAGVCLSYASMVRIFPALFSVALGLYGLVCFLRREPVSWLKKFTMGFAFTAFYLFVAGCCTGRGFDAWIEHYSHIRFMINQTPINGIGLVVPFITSLTNAKGLLVNPTTLYDGTAVVADYNQLLNERNILIWIVRIVFIIIAFWGVFRSKRPETAVVFGLALIFALLKPLCYYWVMLVLLPIGQPLKTCMLFLYSMVAAYLGLFIFLQLIKIGYIANANTAFPVFVFSAIFTILILAWIFFCGEEDKKLDVSCSAASY